MIASDLVLVIGAVSLALVNLGTLALQIITALKVRDTAVKVLEVEKHTNGMKDELVAAAKREGRQEEKDKQ